MKTKKENIVELIVLLVIFFIMCAGILCSCKSTYEYTNNPGTGTMLECEYVYNKTQLDSALISDELPLNFTEQWLNSAYVDYETNKPIVQYFYYKLNNYNEVSEIYKIGFDIINDTDTLYNYSHTHVNTIY